jgi:sensor c-di-GMP phosphodiesterase-like protein
MRTPLVREKIFRRSNRGTMARFGLLLVGAALGGLLSYWIANAVEYRIERKNLSIYTGHLVDQGERLGSEALDLGHTIASDDLVPCSDLDLSLMRNLLVATEHLADTGRIHEGKLECSALVGRLTAPVAVPPADVVLGMTSTWRSAWPVIPSTMRGEFIETDGVWVAINEQTLQDHEESPPMVATELLYDRRSGRMLKSFGPDVPLTLDQIAASKFVERNDTLYQALCRPNFVVCAVGSEPKAAVFRMHRSLLLSRVAIGALMGMLLASLAILLDFRRQSPESRLRKAIRRGEISLVYQPIVDLRTEAIVGAEALARWIKEDGESVSPEVFIALAEDRGFVGAITQLVIQRVIQELGDLLVQSKFQVNLNITAQDLADPAFLPAMERSFDAAHIQRSNLGLELTERSTAAPEIGTEALARLKEAGYTLYIDDFGTGYSSLSYLHRLAVDAIKIDQAFTQTIGTNAVTASVVPQILEMAKLLDLRVVIEGVETREQADYFRKACPDAHAQGWFYSRPVSAGDLRRLIRAQGRRS